MLLLAVVAAWAHTYSQRCLLQFCYWHYGYNNVARKEYRRNSDHWGCYDKLHMANGWRD
jgi:hypothetical protein